MVSKLKRLFGRKQWHILTLAFPPQNIDTTSLDHSSKVLLLQRYNYGLLTFLNTPRWLCFSNIKFWDHMRHLFPFVSNTQEAHNQHVLQGGNSNWHRTEIRKRTKTNKNGFCLLKHYLYQDTELIVSLSWFSLWPSLWKYLSNCIME